MYSSVREPVANWPGCWDNGNSCDCPRSEWGRMLKTATPTGFHFDRRANNPAAFPRYQGVARSTRHPLTHSRQRHRSRDGTFLGW